MIKISSKTQQHQFNNSREKFRFNTSRTYNGSNNPNWRCPQTFEENSRTSFPDINFFRSTPPPSHRVPPPPPPASTCPASSTPTTAPEVPSAVQDPNQTMKIGKQSLESSTQSQHETQLPGTPINPFRCSRRQIHFPRTPNLLNPSSTPISPIPPAQATDLASVTDLTHPTEMNDAGMDAFIKVMEAVYQTKHF
jgi:hypothetical protein